MTSGKEFNKSAARMPTQKEIDDFIEAAGDGSNKLATEFVNKYGLDSQMHAAALMASLKRREAHMLLLLAADGGSDEMTVDLKEKAAECQQQQRRYQGLFLTRFRIQRLKNGARSNPFDRKPR